jgi:hypothetical protein
VLQTVGAGRRKVPQAVACVFLLTQSNVWLAYCDPGICMWLPADTSNFCLLLYAVPAAACRIFVHHYTEFMEASGFDAAAECLNGLIADYRRADSAGPAPVVRMRPRGLTFL